MRQTDLSGQVAIATGATYVSDDVGVSLESVTLDQLGHADRIVVGKDSTTIITDSSRKEALAERIAQIRVEAELTENKFGECICVLSIVSLLVCIFCT